MIKWPWKSNESARSAALPWEEALAIPVLSTLSDEDKSRLVQLAMRFLQQKRLVPLQGFDLDDRKSTRIALLFCLPVLELGIEWLDGFHEVLIYPAPFVVDDEWEDDIGLVHSQRMVQSGQSWQQGPIILNWLDIQDSFDASGFNLIIHEVAHKLDTRNGDRASGVPFIPLPTPPPIRPSALQCYRNISSARPSFSPPASRRCGSVFASFTNRTRCNGYVKMTARAAIPQHKYTKPAL